MSIITTSSRKTDTVLWYGAVWDDISQRHVNFTWGPTKPLSGSCADGTKKKTDMYTHHRGSLCADRMKKTSPHTTMAHFGQTRWNRETSTHTTMAHFVHTRWRRRLTSTHTTKASTHTTMAHFHRWGVKKKTNKYTHHNGSLCADRMKKTDKYTHHNGSLSQVGCEEENTSTHTTKASTHITKAHFVQMRQTSTPNKGKCTHITKAHFVQMRWRRHTSTHTPQRQVHTHHKGSLCADETKKKTSTHTPQRLTLCRWDEEEDKQLHTHTHHKGSLCADETKKKTDKYTHTTKAQFVQMRRRRRQVHTHHKGLLCTDGTSWMGVQHLNGTAQCSLILQQADLVDLILCY